MDLGNFSVSLTVKDIQASKDFYEKLGFAVLHGDAAQGWLILKNGTTNIGLFKGMFDKNIMTFNPGWDHNGKDTESFTDIREIQSKLLSAGVKIEKPVEEGTTKPASFTITDPDGNTILIDQHRSATTADSEAKKQKTEDK
eukprot:m.341165 g.341165  ORF g.341165 m.341165 type:complete len:141 (-) comp19876_c0_seq1:99-521(-)